MNNNVRSAIVGGMSAALVVAAVFAPKFTDRSDETTVRFETSSEQSAIETTTTIVFETTTTTLAPSTTTILVPTTTTTMAPTTTTTLAPIPPTAGAVQLVPEGVSIYFYNYQDARSRAAFPNPAVRLMVTMPDGPQEIVTPLPAQREGRFTIPAPGATDVTIVATEWDGGYLPTGGNIQGVVKR
jgi:hypothetical protein